MLSYDGTRMPLAGTISLKRVKKTTSISEVHR